MRDSIGVTVDERSYSRGGRERVLDENHEGSSVFWDFIEKKRCERVCLPKTMKFLLKEKNETSPQMKVALR